MRRYLVALFGLAALGSGPVRADDPPSAPRPIPLTRPEMKQLIEDMKTRTPRIPLPELTEEDKAKLGERGTSYESRLRYHYLPGGEGQGRGGFGFGGGSSREPDPAMSLDNTFKVQMFWIVCRTNNCQYCQGHQESKLLRAGQKEDAIAALDGDWAGFTPAERAAFAFARKITYEPHAFGDADMDALKKHYSDLQILEMLLSVAGNNAINRWKEGVGVPQAANGGGFGKGAGPVPMPEKHTYLTPTSDRYKTAISKVAPIRYDAKGQPTRMTISTRPPLEPRAEVEKALAAARARQPRLRLADEARARAAMPEGSEKEPVTQWVRLLAHFNSGKGRIASQRTADTKGDLTPLLKAQVSWVIARQDRAWYATGEAKRRLTALGQTDDQVYQLDGDWKAFDDADRALLTVARKLGSSPVVLTDDDVARAVKLAGPRAVVQLVSYVTTRASFDRITEAAGLQIEP
jgi:alkylhydroperoxidase family enzyme